MSLADRLTLTAVSVIVVIFGLALWSLGGKNPHIRWLEWLTRKRMNPRRQIALVIMLLIGLFIVLSIVVHVFSRRPEL